MHCMRFHRKRRSGSGPSCSSAPCNAMASGSCRHLGVITSSPISLPALFWTPCKTATCVLCTQLPPLLLLCSLTGPLPGSWSALDQLAVLRLSENSLAGTLPVEWSTLDQLAVLWLSENSLTGTLPVEWSTLDQLAVLRLSANSFTGTLPVEWSTFQVSTMAIEFGRS